MADFVCKASPCPYDAPGGPLVGPPLGNSAAQRVRISERTLLEAVLWFSMVFEMPVLENALLKRHGADLWSPRTMPLKKAAGEGVDSLGGFLVPENITSAIIQFRQVAGVLRRESTVWPMHRGDLLNVPRRSSGFATSFVGENGTLTETSLQFDSVALSPKKLAGYVQSLDRGQSRHGRLVVAVLPAGIWQQYRAQRGPSGSERRRNEPMGRNTWRQYNHGGRQSRRWRCQLCGRTSRREHNRHDRHGSVTRNFAGAILAECEALHERADVRPRPLPVAGIVWRGRDGGRHQLLQRD